MQAVRRALLQCRDELVESCVLFHQATFLRIPRMTSAVQAVLVLE
jgi:hypothetical protein